MKIQLIPTDEITYESTHSVDELIARIHNLIEINNPLLGLAGYDESKLFLGSVSHNKFELLQIIYNRKSLVIAKGEINRESNKTIIKAKFEVEFFQLLFLIGCSIFFLLIFFGLVFFTQNSFFQLLIFPILSFVLLLIMNAYFDSQVKKMKSTFEGIFQDCP